MCLLFWIASIVRLLPFVISVTFDLVFFAINNPMQNVNESVELSNNMQAYFYLGKASPCLPYDFLVSKLHLHGFKDTNFAFLEDK